MTKEEALKEFRKNIDHIDCDLDYWGDVIDEEFIKVLDTYAMEFLKECLPEEHINLEKMEFETQLLRIGWNDCRHQTLECFICFFLPKKMYLKVSYNVLYQHDTNKYTQHHSKLLTLATF